MEHLHTVEKSNVIHTLKDPGSAISHFIGMILWIIGSFPLVTKAIHTKDTISILSIIIFCISLILLYFASTLYHSVIANSKTEQRLKKLDHMAIYVLIAGTYTPMCTLVLGRPQGMIMLVVIWSIALLGIVLTSFWVNSPKWLNSTIYVLMGWTVILGIKPLYHALASSSLFWLFLGGIIYTIGGIIYALKPVSFNERHPYFGTHEIFHVLCNNWL